MSINRVFSILAILLILSACKKSTDYDYDQEGLMALDTATYLRSVNYISSTPTQIVVQIEIATLNGLDPDLDYTGMAPMDSVVDAGLFSTTDFTYSFNTPSAVTIGKASEFTSVLLLNTYNPWWYSYYEVSPYLQRFFINTEGSPFSKYALSMIEKDGGSPELIWLTENGTNHFENGWQHSSEEVIYETASGGLIIEDSNMVSLDNFKNIINGIISEVGSDIEFSGDRSITIFSDHDFGVSAWTAFDAADVDNIVAAATANTLSINFIGPKFDYVATMIAHGTGGFLFEGTNYVGNPKVVDIVETNPVRDLGVAVQNLDRMLIHEIVVNRFTMTIDATTAIFNSGEYYWFSFIYDGKVYEIAVKIP